MYIKNVVRLIEKSPPAKKTKYPLRIFFAVPRNTKAREKRKLIESAIKKQKGVAITGDTPKKVLLIYKKNKSRINVTTPIDVYKKNLLQACVLIFNMYFKIKNENRDTKTEEFPEQFYNIQKQEKYGFL